MNPEDIKQKIRNNIFVYRMKRVAKKKSMDRETARDIQGSVIGVQVRDRSWDRERDREKNSVERFLTYEQVEKQQMDRTIKPLNLSQNLRQTLSPKTSPKPQNPPSTKLTKLKQQLNSIMPQLTQIQKNRNNLSLIFSTATSTSSRPLWRSLELRPHKAAPNGSGRVSKCAIFRRVQEDNEEIQFYNTNNIFIFKKIKEKDRELPVLRGSEIKPAYIKYKKQENFIGSRSERKQIDRNSFGVNEAKHETFHQPMKATIKQNEHNPQIAHTKQSGYRNTYQHKFIQGKFLLQPWNFSIDDHQIRASPLVFQ